MFDAIPTSVMTLQQFQCFFGISFFPPVLANSLQFRHIIVTWFQNPLTSLEKFNELNIERAKSWDNCSNVWIYLFEIALHQKQTNLMRWHRCMIAESLMAVIIYKTVLFETIQGFIDILVTGAYLSKSNAKTNKRHMEQILGEKSKYDASKMFISMKKSCLTGFLWAAPISAVDHETWNYLHWHFSIDVPHSQWPLVHAFLCTPIEWFFLVYLSFRHK